MCSNKISAAGPPLLNNLLLIKRWCYPVQDDIFKRNLISYDPIVKVFFVSK